MEKEIIKRPCKYKDMLCKFRSVVCDDDSMCKDCDEKTRRKELESRNCPIMEKMGFKGEDLKCGDFRIRALLPHYVVCTEDICPRAKIKRLHDICGKTMLNKVEDLWEIVSAIEEAFHEAA
jgi:hypothetical protein